MHWIEIWISFLVAVLFRHLHYWATGNKLMQYIFEKLYIFDNGNNVWVIKSAVFVPVKRCFPTTVFNHPIAIIYHIFACFVRVKDHVFMCTVFKGMNANNDLNLIYGVVRKYTMSWSIISLWYSAFSSALITLKMWRLHAAAEPKQQSKSF